MRANANMKPTKSNLPEQDASAENFLNEIEEDLREEQIKALWKEYGPTIILSVILAVLLTAAISFYRNWNDAVNGAQTATVVTALNSADPAAVDKAAAEARPGLRALAWLNEGGLYLGKGNKDGALAVYQKAAADGHLPATYQDLARLLAVRLEWSMADTKKVDAEKLLKDLQPVLSNGKSPWFAQAGLQAAEIAARGLNDYNRAHVYLDAVQKDGDSPESLQKRAAALDQVYKMTIQPGK